MGEITILPGRLVHRTRPINLFEEGETLFQHELVKELPPSSVWDLQNWRISGLDLVAGRKEERAFRIRAEQQQGNHLPAELPQAGRTNQLENAVRLTDWKSGNFFHWITEVVPKILIVKSKFHSFHILLPKRLWRVGFVRETFELLGLEPYLLGSGQTILVEHLIWIPDLSPTGNPRPEHLQDVRSFFRDELRPHIPDLPATERIWVSRRKARRRHILNEPLLEDWLRANDFEVICLEDFTMLQALGKLQSARVLAGPHGAGLTNMVFLEPESSIWEIRREGDRANNCFFSMASGLGLPYAFSEARGLFTHRNSPMWLSRERLVATSAFL